MIRGFVDGSKRIGFAATYTFLALNDVVIEVEENEPAYFALAALSDGTFNKNTIEDRLHRHLAG